MATVSSMGSGEFDGYSISRWKVIPDGTQADRWEMGIRIGSAFTLYLEPADVDRLHEELGKTIQIRDEHDG